MGMKHEPFKHLSELLKVERNDIISILTYGVVVAILSFSVPLGVQAVVNSVAYTNLAQPVFYLALAIFIGQVLGASFKTLQILVVERLQLRFFTSVAMELADRIPRTVRNRPGRFVEMVNRFFDVITVQKNLASLLLDGFSLALQMFFGLTLLAFYHPVLLAYDLLLIAGIFVVFWLFGKGAIETSLEKSVQKYRVASWLEEIATSAITFSSKSGRTLALDKANLLLNDYQNARSAHFKILLRQMIGLLSLQAVMNTVLLGLGVVLIGKNQLSIGQLVAAEIVVSTVLYSLTRFQKHLEAFYDLIAALDKVGSLLSLEAEANGGSLPDTGAGIEMVFKEVSFNFGGGANSRLAELSFTCKPFTSILLTGSNGSGKSIVIDLIYGLRSPTAGYILLNGRDSRAVAPELLREEIALVRSVEIIPGTVFENVALGKKDADQDKVAAALSSADLLAEVLSLPQGLDTVLSTSGAPLSVSQAERLMLARAFFREPKILLLDEALDNIDSRTRDAILNILFSKSRPFTLVVASHSSQLKNRCQQVIDLDQINARRAA